MSTVLLIQTTAQLEQLSDLGGLRCLERQIFQQHTPDAHWVMLENNQVVGYYSLWWQQVPAYSAEQVGFLGHYNVRNGSVAPSLLSHACQELAAHGCTLAIAPIDGTTWRRYRLLSDRGSEPLFFLEPDNPDEWCDQFRQQGFTPFAEYSSALNADLTQWDPRMERVERRLSDLGVKVRSLHLENFDRELERIYNLSRVSFQHNFLYTPIEREEFLTQYSQIKPYIHPNLVLIAEHQDELVGFLFAVPDLLQAKRGVAINTVIIKTVAILPGRRYAGLGNWLVSQVQAIAHQLGYTRAIHALMHDANNSRNLSSHYATPIRRYTLFSKKLE